MDEKQKDPIVEAFVYLKNGKIINAIGVLTEIDNCIVFSSGDFKSIITIPGVSLIIKDDIHDLLKGVPTKELHGFEIYMKSGTPIAFNGWCLDANTYLSKQGDHIVLYEDVVFLKVGPEDPGKNPKTPEEKKEKKENGNKEVKS